ncbi:unnamed protein product, partial [Ceratitis capitata]
MNYVQNNVGRMCNEVEFEFAMPRRQDDSTTARRKGGKSSPSCQHCSRWPSSSTSLTHNHASATNVPEN